MKKKIKKIIFVIIFAVAVELLIFNFNYVLASLTPQSNNLRYSLDQIQTINWQRNGDTLVSEYDPILIIPNLNMKVRTIRIIVEASKPIRNVVVFYNNDQFPVFSEKTLISNTEPLVKSTTITLNQRVNDVRIDLGDEAGLTIKDITVIINPIDFDFSFSRIIAIILMYLSIIGLSVLQKAPAYQLEAGE